MFLGPLFHKLYVLSIIMQYYSREVSNERNEHECGENESLKRNNNNNNNNNNDNNNLKKNKT